MTIVSKTKLKKGVFLSKGRLSQRYEISKIVVVKLY